MYQNPRIDNTVKYRLLYLEKVHINDFCFRIGDPEQKGVRRELSAQRHLEPLFEDCPFFTDQFWTVPLTETDRCTQQRVIVADMGVEAKTNRRDVVSPVDRFGIESLYVEGDIFKNSPLFPDPAEFDRIVHKNIIGIGRVGNHRFFHCRVLIFGQIN